MPFGLTTPIPVMTTRGSMLAAAFAVRCQLSLPGYSRMK